MKIRKFLSLLLCFVLILSLTVPAAAAEGGDAAFYAAAEECAAQLHALGLFRGTGVNTDGTPVFTLEGEARRDAAVTMIVRLLGAETEALSVHYPHTFTDAGWATDYIGYAFAKGITKGTSADGLTFGSVDNVTRSQFVTLILRALGYADVDYRNPYPLADEVGLFYGTDGGEDCRRAYLAIISLSALGCPLADGSGTLFAHLEAQGVFDAVTDPKLPVLPAFFTGEETTSGSPVIPQISANSEEKMLTKLDAAIAAYTPEITIFTPNGVEEAWLDLVFDEFNGGRFAGIGAMSATYLPNHGKIVLTPEYCGAVRVMAYLEGKSDQLSAEDESLLLAARSLYAELYYDGITDYDALKAVHDHLVNTITYQETGERSHDAVGAMVDGLSVCEGYTEAFDLMCYLFGIECLQIVGSARGDHAWNLVNLDGQWYHVDVTWDDPVSSEPILRHDYFLISDETISADHSWEWFPSTPSCPSDY